MADAKPDRMSILRNICEDCKKNNIMSYDRAIQTLEKEVDRKSHVLGAEDRSELYEHLAFFYHFTSVDGYRQKEYEALDLSMQLQLEDNFNFKLPYTLKILGDMCHSAGDLDIALDEYHSALNLYADTDENRGVREELFTCIAQVEAEKLGKELIKDEENQKKATEDKRVQAIKKGKQKKAADKPRKELIEDEQKQKKETEIKMVQAKEKEEQEKAKSFVEENPKEVEGPVGELEIEENVGAGNLPMLYIHREFTASFSVSLSQKIGRNCYSGSLQSSSVRLPKSFVEASSCHMSQLSSLISLGRKHECLLNVENLVVDPMDQSKLLVTEVIYPVEAFFRIKYDDFMMYEQEGTWWDYISGMFWRIFRDVTRGLMFLYEKTEFACGNLSFNCFVTSEDRGRILPTLEHMSNKGREDMKQLLQLMKSVLYIPSNGEPDTSLHLPSALTEL